MYFLSPLKHAASLPLQELLAKLAEVDVDVNGITPKKRIKIVDCHAKDVKKYKITRRVAVDDDKF